MKFLMFSESGEGAGLLHRIEEEGNEVALFIVDKIYKDVYEGVVNKVKNPDEFIDKNTVIIFDMSGNGVTADRYKRSGNLVYGASDLMDQMEHDRQFGYELMNKCGIQTPKYEIFKDFNKAKDYINSKEAPKRLVFKPNASMPAKLTYVSKDRKELLAYLTFIEKHYPKDEFILQEFVEGLVVSSEMFCTGKTTTGYNHTVESKKSMNDDLGASTGSSGNTTWICDMDYILTDGILLMEDWCVENGYRGQLDLNTVVNDSGVYGLEFTPRFGYDATPTLMGLLYDDLGKFYFDIASGNSFNPDFRDDYASAVRFTIPPYPAEPKSGIDSEAFSPNEDLPILNWEDHAEDIYFYEIKKDKEGNLVHSSGTGVIGLTIGKDEDVEKSFDKPYEILKKIHVPDMQYRTDLKEVISKQIKELQVYA